MSTPAVDKPALACSAFRLDPAAGAPFLPKQSHFFFQGRPSWKYIRQEVPLPDLPADGWFPWHRYPTAPANHRARWPGCYLAELYPAAIRWLADSGARGRHRSPTSMGNRFSFPLPDFKRPGSRSSPTGHCHPRVVQAIQQQAARLIHMSGTDFLLTKNMVTLGRKAGEHRSRRWSSAESSFGNSGTEAMEAAMKLARYYI